VTIPFDDVIRFIFLAYFEGVAPTTPKIGTLPVIRPTSKFPEIIRIQIEVIENKNIFGIDTFNKTNGEG